MCISLPCTYQYLCSGHAPHANPAKFDMTPLRSVDSESLSEPGLGSGPARIDPLPSGLADGCEQHIDVAHEVVHASCKQALPAWPPVVGALSLPASATGVPARGRSS